MVRLLKHEGSNRRDGYMAVLEFQPNERLHSTIDLFYSQFDRQENKYGLQTGLLVTSGIYLAGTVMLLLLPETFAGTLPHREKR